MKFVIRTQDSILSNQTEYIGTGTYVVNGEKYAALVGTDISQAKRYSSYSGAENAIKKLMNSCCNVSLIKYQIIGVED
ncbi:hypothetical protein [Anaerocolumna xylanovorans]|uniref:Uncharacterized protein n=1 Tax=Anaerocolumna xylanovorans DSM 12503 TaxID=1121345 RepID=A0A1M7YC03_9FIRM|nr:hypothetical protein [Anaerocolumna xylanovorans]SHO50172.1 hypothetical protein SAMN02745217_02618 [Anaerocolumna xylanovorans DSM 12503]